MYSDILLSSSTTTWSPFSAGEGQEARAFKAGCRAMWMRAALVGTGVLDCPFSGNTTAHRGVIVGAIRDRPLFGVLSHLAASYRKQPRQAPSGMGGGGKKTLPA